MAELTFHGGSISVTGANYLLEFDTSGGKIKILIDCGLFQGSYYSEELNYEKFAYDPSEISAVFVTHSHVDHMGRLPKLYKEGFRGTIYATEPTCGILEVALPDTLNKVVEEAQEMNHPPLYTEDDFKEMLKLVKGIRYNEEITLAPEISVILKEASHILGSSIVQIKFKEEGKEKQIAFTGDLGNPPTILLNPIDYVSDVDYVVIDSAYGHRIHTNREERRTLLLGAIEETIKDGGVLMIPSFAVERTQEILLELDKSFEEKRLPTVPIFLDSPLATRITEVYSKFSNYFNPEAVALLKDNNGLFNFPWLRFTRSVSESKSINDTRGPKVIIAGSGMSQGGRILHHERRYLPDPRSSILFVGYQVAGSLGRRILDGEKEVRIFGEKIPVRCQVKALQSYSAHADQNGILEFIRKANEGRGIKKVFLVQGEDEAIKALEVKIDEELNIQATGPQRGMKFQI